VTAGIGIAYIDGPRLRRRLPRSGRVGRLAAWLGSRLNIKPILSISVEGTLDPVSRSRGIVAPVIAAHAGIGAWGVFYQIEDGTNA
jgi:fatty acid-binding protein DegV